MFEHSKTENILFIDIETVPLVYKFNDLSEKYKQLWDKKSYYFRKADDTPESVYDKAGIFAEFGKIICISTGFINKTKHERVFRTKSFYGDNEKELLQGFFKLLNKYYHKSEHILCAHNGKEFDFPYICRRAVINGLPLPKILHIAGKKSWEVHHIDTLELWKFGDYKHYTSLDLLTAVFDIPSSKDDIDGSQVAKIYYENNDLPRIVEYCQKDTLAVAQLFLRFKNEELITQVEIVD